MADTAAEELKRQTELLLSQMDSMSTEVQRLQHQHQQKASGAL